MRVLSVNLGRPVVQDFASAADGRTSIGKHPTAHPVQVAAPGPKHRGGSGLAGDSVSDLRHHGGDDQAVYAYAREDLDWWEGELERPLHNGIFGENITTAGLDVNGALIGERWLLGSDLVLEVASERIPCRTFAGWLDEKGWVKRFVAAGRPGPYLRVIEPGVIRAGDPVRIVYRPSHEVTVSFLLRAESSEKELLPRVLAAGEALHPDAREYALKYVRANHTGD